MKGRRERKKNTSKYTRSNWNYFKSTNKNLQIPRPSGRGGSLYGIELAYIAGNKYKKLKTDLMKKAHALTKYGTIPAVAAQKKFIETLLHTDYFDNGSINEFETIRSKLRDLMQYLEHEESRHYDTNFIDDIIEVKESPPEYDTDDLKNYKMKAEYYIR